MEDKKPTTDSLHFSKTLVFLSIVAFSVIVGGLFFNSSPAGQNRVANTPNGPQDIYFTAVRLPEKLDFADEKVPLENFDVRESLDREMLIVANFHSQVLLYLKKTNRYFSVIEPILKANKVPDDFKYLALAESGFLDKIVSPAGAVGIWQFMKDAAIENGLEVNEEVDERYHIEKSTEAACKYLNKSFERYKSWTMVAASYNAGVGGVNRQIDIQDSKDYYDLLLNEETSRYLFRILALKLVISEPEKYGFKMNEDEKYPVIPANEVKVTGSVLSFTDFARENKVNYKLLKQFNPWLRQPYLKNLKKKTYSVKIPEVGKYRKFVYEENKD
jgi:membrane-bound lytic murein transglycosylase D